MEQLSLQIEGMSCAHCVRAVTSALRAVDGVVLEGVEVGRARLRFDPDLTSRPAIERAIVDAGYEITPVAA